MLKLFFKDDGFIPNSRFPVLVHRGAIRLHGSSVPLAQALLGERALRTGKGWKLEWLWKVYKRPHYHSTTHEALVVWSGSATLQLGGHRVGKLVKVGKGDAILITAGVAHRAVERTEDFQVFGLYPFGAKPWDMLFCRKRERTKAIANLALLGEPPNFYL